ncbi:MAG: UvrD-helicase domain-containing protein [Planctomycetes bacterium]|nr:UvrD-helicase domain-containing protein [Planctomycetota bacterium]
MEFRIADTFTDSLGKLTGEEQKAAKTTAFDLQMNPASPGMRFHKLDRAKDKNFWSVRVSGDIRLIVHKASASLMLCYVAHHDQAYEWAERRKIERHPKTGAAQIVEVRETVREVIIPKYVEVEQPAPPKPPLFAGVTDEDLLGYGIPEEWLTDVREATEDTLFDLAEHLPAEAAEALLELATGSTPLQPAQIAEGEDPFNHPDAQRRFRVMTDVEELKRALDFPWEKWTVFLHPAQRELVARDYSGPARISGSAGTGKTIVALHRAVHLAKTNTTSKVLLTTFSIPLARNLLRKLGRLTGDEPGLTDRIVVRAIDEVGLELYESTFGTPTVPTPTMLKTLLKAASEAGEDHRFSLRFLESEWTDVVDAWQLDTWEAYRDVARLGRKTRLGEKQRVLLWSIFDRLRADLHERGFVTIPTVFASVAASLSSSEISTADFVVIDEAQDISVPQLKFLAAMAGSKECGLFFAGDLGQRIFQTPFSWKCLGVDIRGRSHTLRINYRTSHQIRRQADRLLEPEMADVDGNRESRRGTVSVFNGPDPSVEVAESKKHESALIASWLADRMKDGVEPHEIGVFVRSDEELPRARAAVAEAGLNIVDLDSNTDAKPGCVSVGTMHLAKGLEFRAVVVAGCDDEIIPLQGRIEAVADDADLEEVYNTERHLLYVACTRARDHLLIIGVDPVSEFLDDIRAV